MFAVLWHIFVTNIKVTFIYNFVAHLRNFAIYFKKNIILGLEKSWTVLLGSD